MNNRLGWFLAGVMACDLVGGWAPIGGVVIYVAVELWGWVRRRKTKKPEVPPVTIGRKTDGTVYITQCDWTDKIGKLEERL